MTFQFNQNIVPANMTNAIFLLKTFLVSIGWSVVSSSDGSVYDASGDVITNYMPGAGGLGNTRAWFVIEQPLTTRSFCFQRGGDANWRVKYSPAGFTSGFPSATTTPTGTAGNDNIIFGSGTDASPTYGYFSANYNRAQIGADDASPNGFYFLTYNSGTNYVGNVLTFDPIANYPSDADPYMVYIDNSITSLQYANMYSARYPLSPNGYFARGLSQQSFAKIPANVYAYGYNNQVAIAAPFNLQVNVADGYDDCFPIFYMTTISGINCYKGLSSIMKWAATTRPLGYLLSVVSTGDRIIFGHVNLPWNGTTPSL